MPNMACGADMNVGVGDLVEYAAYPQCRGIVKSVHHPRGTGARLRYRKAIVLWFPLSAEASTKAPWSIQRDLYSVDPPVMVPTLKLRVISSTKNSEVK